MQRLYCIYKPSMPHQATTEGPLVSIIVTAYNVAAYAAEAIGSLLAQECPYPFEVIVVNDASTDATAQVLAQFTDPRLKIVSFPKNQGVCQAVNEGFALARGKYCCRFDADDRWSPNYLAETVPILEKFPQVGLVHTDVAFIDAQGHITSASGNIARPFATPIANELGPILHYNYICNPSVVARREAWDLSLPWPDAIRQGPADWRALLIMANDWDFYYVNKPLAHYRIHTTNMHRSMIRNGHGERNSFFTLEECKARFGHRFAPSEWQRLHAHHLRHWGIAYFGADMEAEALRCFGQALRLRPRYLTDFYLLRLLFGAYIGKKNYNFIKKIFISST